ncbi:MAG: alpha/beta hydrolase [Candidatus Obscuribacterales bacterium]|nr:alpha/beta hydrolase [Candidatus Obscuribacterales bacterium]
MVEAGSVSTDSAESSSEEEEEEDPGAKSGSGSVPAKAAPVSLSAGNATTTTSPTPSPVVPQEPMAPIAPESPTAVAPSAAAPPARQKVTPADMAPTTPKKTTTAETAAKKAPTFVVTGMRPIQNINYAGTKSQSQTMDIYQPLGVAKPSPVVVWIHGGSWLGGSKASCPATFLVSAGFTTVSINYRLSGEAPFPAQILDCKMAILYLRKHAKELNIDPSRIGVWGASAGGHLAALLGTTGDSSSWDKDLKKVGVSAKVQAVCDWCGPTDLREMNRKLATKEISRGQVEPIFKLLANRCTAEWLTAASPVTFATPDAPPFLIMHGDRDGTVPVDQSRYLHNLLKSKKVDSTLYVLKGAGHSFESPVNARIVLEFFKRTLQS